MSRKLKENTQGWRDTLRNKLRNHLQQMNRAFVDNDLETAMNDEDVQHLTVSGVDFFISRN